MKRIAILWTAIMALLLATDIAANANTGDLINTTPGNMLCYAETVTVADNVSAPAGTTKTHYSDCTYHVRKGPNYMVAPTDGASDVTAGDISIPSVGLTCTLGFQDANANPHGFFARDWAPYFDGTSIVGFTPFYVGYNSVKLDGANLGTCRFTNIPATTYNVEGVYMYKAPFSGNDNLHAPLSNDVETEVAVVIALPGTNAVIRVYMMGFSH